MTSSIRLTDDYFAAETLTIDHLRKELDGRGIVAFKGTLEVAAIDENKQITPAVYVTFGGDSPAEGGTGSVGQGVKQAVDQLWFVVLTVRTAEQIKTGTKLRAKAGPTLQAIMKAMAAWSPGPDFRPFHRRGGIQTQYSQDGAFAYFALGYVTRIITP